MRGVSQRGRVLSQRNTWPYARPERAVRHQLATARHRAQLQEQEGQASVV
ncbi:hypothetical protein [Streptomyces sp. NPDC006879]